MAQRIFRTAYTEKLKAGLHEKQGLDKYLSGNFHHLEMEMLFKERSCGNQCNIAVVRRPATAETP